MITNVEFILLYIYILDLSKTGRLGCRTLRPRDSLGVELGDDGRWSWTRDDVLGVGDRANRTTKNSPYVTNVWFVMPYVPYICTDVV